MKTTTRAQRIAAALLVAGVVLSASPAVQAAAKKTTKKKAKVTKAATTKKGAAPATTAAPAATTAAAAGGSAFGKKSDTLYEGSGGFKIDLSKCPKDYDVNQGITDKEIRLFMSLPKSGPLAGFGLIADGAQSYFNYVNANGGIGGRKLIIDSKDDGYAPDRTKANVTEAVASKKYAALFVTLGTANNLAVWDDTNRECMPQLLNGTGAAQWGDVENHPWTTGMQIDYTSEAQLWADFVKSKFPKGAKVAMLTFNNDYGKSYSRGFRGAVKGSNVSVVKEEYHEATAPNVTNQVTNIMAELPDVVLIQTSGAFCTQAMADLEKRGNGSMVIMSATCASLSQYFQPLIDQGLTGKDTYMVQYIKEVNDREFENDPFVKLFHKVVKEQGLDDKQSTYATGWLFAWFMAEIAKDALNLQGGINRPNLLIANRNFNRNHPLSLPGVTNKMNGLQDAFLNEAGRIARYRVNDPKQLGSWFPQGAVINREGKLGTYTKSLG